MMLFSKKVPSASIWEIFPGIEKVQVDFRGLTYPTPGIVNTSPNDLYVICALIKYLHPKNIFEFGTHDGASTFQFAVNADDSAIIHTIELDKDSFYSRFKNRYTGHRSPTEIDTEVGRHFRDTVQAKKIRQLRGDSYHYDFEPFFKNMDLIFIDGEHSFKYVERDTANGFKMLSDKGIIIWHDYDVYPDVNRFLSQLSGTKKLCHFPETSLVLYKTY